MKIGIKENNVKWDVENSTFRINGGDVKFATTYELVNERTGKSVVFNFDHSTGSEWDNDTEWVYKSDGDVMTLIVGNEEVTNSMRSNYIKAKMR